MPKKIFKANLCLNILEIYYYSTISASCAVVYVTCDPSQYHHHEPNIRFYEFDHVEQAISRVIYQ